MITAPLLEIAVLLLGMNLAVDFAYTILDPRVKYD